MNPPPFPAPVAAPGDPVELLRAFARRDPEVEAEDVIRALVSHGGWAVPLSLVDPAEVVTAGPPEGFGRESEYPPGELWLFTDRDAVLRARAAGSQLGDIGYGAAGVAAFGQAARGYHTVRVNPVSPAELTWHFPPETAALLAAWVRCIAFEELVRGWSRGQPVDAAALLGYRQFQMYLFPNHAALTMPNHGGLHNPGVVLTAPDCGRELLKRVPEGQRHGLRAVYLDGAEMADKFPEQGMDGLAINPAGPGPAATVPLSALLGKPA